jgi:hypothetical protein
VGRFLLKNGMSHRLRRPGYAYISQVFLFYWSSLIRLLIRLTDSRMSLEVMNESTIAALSVPRLSFAKALNRASHVHTSLHALCWDEQS